MRRPPRKRTGDAVGMESSSSRGDATANRAAARSIPRQFSLLQLVPIDGQWAARRHDDEAESAIANHVQLFARGLTNFLLKIGVGHNDTFP